MLDYIAVNMGMIKYAAAPNTLGTILGSCIGLTFYHKEKKIGLLAHIMLPESNGMPAVPTTSNFEEKGKFADIAIIEMINKIKDTGCNLNNIEVKIVGGAQMFKVKKNNSIINIGQRNMDKVKDILYKYNIKIKSEDIGGQIGRKVIFDLETGNLIITYNLNPNEKKII